MIFFVSIVFLVAEFKNIDFIFAYVVMSLRDAMTSLTLYDVTRLTLSISACRYVLEKRFVACLYGCLSCSIRKCHRICICMMI